MEKNSHGAILRRAATKSLWQFNTENEYTELLMFFIFIGNELIPENMERARSILIKAYEDPEDITANRLIAFFESRDANELFDKMFYERHFCQMAFSRQVDNFITYFKDILAEVILKKPQILKSSEHERLDFILNHETMEDLLTAIAEKKISELFYGGIDDIEKFFETRLGLKVFKDEVTKKEVKRLVKQRNLIVHNRGKISKEFAKEFDEFESSIGKYLVFSYEQISDTNLRFNNFLVEVDIMIASKFKLDLLTSAQYTKIVAN